MNRKMLSIKRTKHIKTKFFFVNNKITQCEVQIVHMPTEQMWINMNTKPKQGTPFQVNRSIMVNCPVNHPDETLLMKENENMPITKRLVYTEVDAQEKIAGVCWECCANPPGTHV